MEYSCRADLAHWHEKRSPGLNEILFLKFSLFLESCCTTCSFLCIWIQVWFSAERSYKQHTNASALACWNGLAVLYLQFWLNSLDSRKQLSMTSVCCCCLSSLRYVLPAKICTPLEKMVKVRSEIHARTNIVLSVGLLIHSYAGGSCLSSVMWSLNNKKYKYKCLQGDLKGCCISLDVIKTETEFGNKSSTL